MMIHHDFQRAMVRERSVTLRGGAAARRRARQAGPAGGAAAADAATASRQVRLRDGSAVLIRPVRRTDSPLLAEGFARLSERSRWSRFLGRKNILTEGDLSYFTDI